MENNNRGNTSSSFRFTPEGLQCELHHDPHPVIDLWILTGSRPRDVENGDLVQDGPCGQDAGRLLGRVLGQIHMQPGPAYLDGEINGPLGSPFELP